MLGPVPKAIWVRIEHRDPELREVILVTRIDGNQERTAFESWTNGNQDKARLNGKPVRGSATWEGEELVIEWCSQVGAREMHFCDSWSLSADRQTLSMKHRKGDLAGQLTILERAG
jgi:hypothetical protein